MIESRYDKHYKKNKLKQRAENRSQQLFVIIGTSAAQYVFTAFDIAVFG
jgi:hypothetical protein